MRSKKSNDITPSVMSKSYSDRIAANLSVLLDKENLSQGDLSKRFEEYGMKVAQGTISKYINKTLEIPLSVAVALCEIFHVSISDLCHSEPIDESSEAETAIHPIPTQGEAALCIPKLGDKFITDPADRDFSGYLQDYFCYFFPTLSSEDTILKGTLTLGEDPTRKNVCAATLKLDTNRKKNNEPVYKTYTGCAIISSSVHAMYIVLSSPNEGEVCMLNLRHFYIRHHQLNCRMAEVITNAAGETHTPTVHRMLLSRQEISDQHLEYVKPHLHLNSSDILISEEALNAFRHESEQHDKLIGQLTYTTDKTTLYAFKEDFVRSNAKQLLSKEQLPLFLTEIRAQSHKMRYNKVSSRADENIHNLLSMLGYYSDTDT